MNPAFFLSNRRAPALLAVLLIHLLAGGLLLREPLRRPPSLPSSTELRLIRLPTPAPAPASVRPPPRSAAARPVLPVLRQPAANTITLPAAPSPATETPTAAVSPAASAAAPTPLDLRLPPRVGAAPTPTIAEQIRADGRANSPRESAEQRMANAMGGPGWRSIDLGDGAKKLMGPFGECFISRPSLVNQIPGHPHAGLVPDKVFGCGGIEKGSLKHERPK